MTAEFVLQALILESESDMIRMDVWDLLDQVGVGLKSDDPDAPVSSHRAAWKSIGSHMLGIPARSVLPRRPEETLVVHGLMKWFTDVVRCIPYSRYLLIEHESTAILLTLQFKFQGFLLCFNLACTHQ